MTHGTRAAVPFHSDPYDNGDVQHGGYGAAEGKLLGSANHYVGLPLQRGR